MKYIFYCFLLITGMSLFSACSNGDYITNPSTNANASVNPLHPLKASDFNWPGTDPMSADINGVHFVASGCTYSFDSGKNILMGYNGSKTLTLYLMNAWVGNLYSMGYNQYNTSGYWTDSFGVINNYYFSNLGNSGGLYMLKNDTFSGGYIKGLFYFQGVNAQGEIINVTHGYFNVQKW